MAHVLELLNASGTKVAQLDGKECSVAVSREMNATWNAYVTYPIPPEGQGEDKSSYLIAWRYRVRIRNLDDGTYNTYVIMKSDRQKVNGTLSVVAYAEHLGVVDLQSNIVAETVDFVNVTPTVVLTRILTHVAGWAVGTVGPTAPVSVYLSFDTALSALQKLLVACTGEYDIDEPNGQFDISASLGANNSVPIRAERNLKSIRNTQYSREVINQMYGVGGGQPPATIAGTPHIVNGYDGGTGSLSIVGNKVVAESDSWNTYKVKFLTGTEAGNSFTISDCAAGASNDTLTIDAALGTAAGDKFVITTSGGTEVAFIRAGASITSYGTVQGRVRNSRYSDAVNLVETAALSGTYAAGLCEDWTEEGSPGTKAENTTSDFIQYGSSSQKIIGAADADGISQIVNVTADRYYTMLVWVYITAGTVKVSLTDGTSTWDLSKDATGWQRFVITELSVGATLTVKVLQDGAPAATFYIDAVQITEGVLIRSFMINSELKLLWDQAYDKLIEKKDPLVEYDVSFVDLYKIDPEGFPYDQVNLGDTVSIYDTELGLSDITARIRRLDYDPFRPEMTHHTVSNL